MPSGPEDYHALNVNDLTPEPLSVGGGCGVQSRQSQSRTERFQVPRATTAKRRRPGAAWDALSELVKQESTT